MADTRAQKNAEKWICENYLPAHFDGLLFEEKKLKLIWGGEFAFDAVSAESNPCVALISTSSARTAGHNLATAKIQKLKADTLYLLNIAIPCRKRCLIFTEKNMRDHFQNENKNGRFPDSDIIELMHVPLPQALQDDLLQARHHAQLEVTPAGLSQ